MDVYDYDLSFTRGYLHWYFCRIFVLKDIELKAEDFSGHYWDSGK